MRHSLRLKAFLLIIIIALLLGAVSIFVSGRAVTQLIRNNYEDNALALAKTAAVVIDGEALASLKDKTADIYSSLDPSERVNSDEWGSDEFNAYLDHFKDLNKTREYQTLLRQLREIQDVNDVDCVYTLYLEAENEETLYLVDAATEDPCPIGVIDSLLEQNLPILTDPTIGFPPYITNTEEYGHLITAGAPVYDEDGKTIAYAMVDVSMNEVIGWRNRMIAIIVALMLFLMIIVCVIANTVVNRTVVRPINQLSSAAEDYRKEDDLISHNRFSSLDIHTGDEIQGLSESMKQMEKDLNEKVSSLLSTTDALNESRRQASELNAMAMKDAMTGVNNKRSYDIASQHLGDILESGNDRFGLVVVDLNDLKVINDTHGHEKGDIAIKQLCSIICRVFNHSPVYRIGGDEFAVILQGKDYDNIDPLMTEFNSALLTVAENGDLQPWERVNAAIGFALFDHERDESVSDTFRRADRAMYQRKHDMKVGRD